MLLAPQFSAWEELSFHIFLPHLVFCSDDVAVYSHHLAIAAVL